MVQGLLPTLLVGLVGSALAEVIRLAGPLTNDKGPQDLREYLGSLAYFITGAAVLLYIPWDEPHRPLEVAAAGAAVPALFPAAVRSAGSIRDRIGAGRDRRRFLATTADAEITKIELGTEEAVGAVEGAGQEREPVEVMPRPRGRSLFDYMTSRF